MNDVACDLVGPLLNPQQIGELIDWGMDALSRNVPETPERLRYRRKTLSKRTLVL